MRRAWCRFCSGTSLPSLSNASRYNAGLPGAPSFEYFNADIAIAVEAIEAAKHFAEADDRDAHVGMRFISWEVAHPEFMRLTFRLLIRNGIRRFAAMDAMTNELALFHSQAWLDAVPALKRVDTIVDATFTKILKPDPRAYRMGLEALRARPEQTLFVDDQLRNVRGAEAAGLHALHFDVRRPAEMIREIRARLGLPMRT